MTEWRIENPENIKEADLVVGIPSLNEEAAIRHTTEQVALGLETYFGDLKTVIINLDNNSTDGTREAFLNAESRIPRMRILTAEGVSGKGNNIRNLLKIIPELGAKGALVVDADLRSLTPKWIKNLGEPLFNDFGFVAPIYLRHKYDGTITNNIVYPVTRCLYGRRVRQPVGGDVGFSSDMAAYFLENDTWTEAVANYGIDIWMTTLAMHSRKPITQAFLGTPKVHRVRDPSGEIGAPFRQVVETMFNLQVKFAPFWKEVKRSRPTAIFGFGLGESDVPPPVHVDAELLYERFTKGCLASAEIFREVLEPATRTKISEVLELGERHLEFPTLLWAKCLFEFSLAYRDRIFDAVTLLDALSPLYFGKTLSFVRSTEGMGVQQAEEYIEEQCLAFEEVKPYLLERWG